MHVSIFDQKEPITLQEAAKRMPNRPCLNSVRRWARRGINGYRLRTWRVGRNRMTSAEALEEFIANVSGTVRSHCDPLPDAPASDAHLKAENQLDAMGV